MPSCPIRHISAPVIAQEVRQVFSDVVAELFRPPVVSFVVSSGEDPSEVPLRCRLGLVERE
eukprot:7140124-Pyramimonas_sp.AAC.1